MSNVRRQPGRSPYGSICVYVPDQALMESAAAALSFGFGPKKVQGTTDLEEVSDWLRDGDPAVLVTGVEHGAELACAARSRFARLPIVMLSPDRETAADISSCVRLLPSEFGDEELRGAIEDLLPGRSTPHLADRNPSAPLFELLQLLVRSGYRGTLQVIDTDAGGIGHIGIRSQTICDARVDGQRVTGLGALLEISRWKNREFRWSEELRDAVTLNVTVSDLFDQFEAVPDGATSEDNETAESAIESTLTPFRGPNSPDLSRRESEIDETLEKLSEVDGFIAVALVDCEEGMSLAKLRGNNDFDLDVAAAVNTAVVQKKMRTVSDLGLDDSIEDIVITLDDQYHLIRPLDEHPNFFFYLAVDRAEASLVMARMSLSDAERVLDLS